MDPPSSDRTSAGLNFGNTSLETVTVSENAMSILEYMEFFSVFSSRNTTVICVVVQGWGQSFTAVPMTISVLGMDLLPTTGEAEAMLGGFILPTPGEAKAKAMPGRLYIHT